MKHKFSLVLIFVFIMLFHNGLQAQILPDETKTAIGNYLTGVIRQQTAVQRISIDSVAMVKKKLQLFANENLSYGAFNRTMTDSIYAKIKVLLPEDRQAYAVELYSDGYKIEDYIPFNHKERLPAKVDIPLKKNLSSPYQISKGLQSRHIALWQSHGWYYEKKLSRWEWQRARIFQTVEDLFTQSFVLPYLVPMLENAGANVFLPRERDTQRHEIIVDNDRSQGKSTYMETVGAENWSSGDSAGFAHLRDIYYYQENPFRQGTYRQAKTQTKGKESTCAWQPDIPEKGKYAVYIAYTTLKNSAKDARYTVYHSGGKTEFSINQTMGGGTWIFLGYFSFDKGVQAHGKIVLSNLSKDKNRIITADAVKIGGGMGNIARGEQAETSGYPRYTEGARYWLQWAGVPDSVYSWSKNENDYTDDYQSRGLWVNYLSGGSANIPKADGLHIPIDAVLAFHSDAGTTYNDSIIGTLGICMTHYHDEKFANGSPRILSRDLVATVMDEIVNAIRVQYEPDWTRRHIWNRSYSEARLPEAPTMLLELLSHQNFADMRYGLDPAFRFTVSRSIYKGFLKFIAGRYQSDYTVAPLPVKSFSAQFADDNRVHLEWLGVNDPLEPTAAPTGYIVYTATGDNDFDSGVWVKDSHADIPVEKDILYRFKITAVNAGGESFPSEILSTCKKTAEKGLVLIVNGFDRLSAPYHFASKDSIAGFLDGFDHGVPDHVEYNYIGSQHEFRRIIPWMDDDAAGFGASNANYETSLIAGNTFDYPNLHGKAVANAGYSFVSTSAEAITSGQFEMNRYRMTDLILGKQKQTPVGRGAFPPRFKTFPDSLQAKITAYCRQGGHIFVSGAFVGTDLWDNPDVKDSDKAFARDVLKYQWRTDHAAVTGQVKSVASPLQLFKGNYAYHHQLNPDFYAVESPDAVEPVGEGSHTVFRYSENNLSAGVAYSGDYKTCILGFPFETIKDESLRYRLMDDLLRFMLQPE
jgi:hypothetical protein